MIKHKSKAKTNTILKKPIIILHIKFLFDCICFMITTNWKSNYIIIIIYQIEKNYKNKKFNFKSIFQ